MGILEGILVSYYVGIALITFMVVARIYYDRS